MTHSFLSKQASNKSKFKSSLALAAAISALLSQSAHATILATGNAYIPSQVNLSQQVTVGSWYLGIGSQTGSLEVNASPLGNGLTSFTATGLIIGEYGGDGIVKVIGNGTAGSAQININPGFGLRNSMGAGSGLLEVKSGGLIQSYEHVYLGNQGFSSALSGNATTNIDGSGSVLRAQQTSTGESWEREGGRIYVGFDGQSTSTVNITNGGVMEALSGHVGDDGDDGSIWIGTSADSGSTATVNVAGAGSVMRASDYIEVGSRPATNTTSKLNISAGGRVEVVDDPDYVEMSIATLDGVAAVKVTGAGSTLDAQHIQIGGTQAVVGFTAGGAVVTSPDWGAVEVGAQVKDVSGNLVYDQNGNAVVGVDGGGFVLPSTYTAGNRIYLKETGSLLVENGGKVQSDNISVSTDSRDVPTYNGQRAVMTVRNGGVVESDVHVFKGGELNGNGTITGDVIVDGGILAPGNSPGTITIEGNLVLTSGVLELEIGGFGAGEFDMVHVLGDLIADEGFDVKLKLLNNFTPSSGQEFEFLNIEGVAGFDFSLVNLILDESVPSGFNLNFAGGRMSLVSTAPVPVPAAAWLFGTGLFGLLGLKRRTAVG